MGGSSHADRGRALHAARDRTDDVPDRRVARRPADVTRRLPARSCTATSRSARGEACSVGASTITRTRGSVPLWRSRTRPSSPELGLHRPHLRPHRLGPSQGVAIGHRHVAQHLWQPVHHGRRPGRPGAAGPGPSDRAAAARTARRRRWSPGPGRSGGPDCSPPSDQPCASRASSTWRSPTGVWWTVTPAAAMARWKPRLVMTVTTTVSARQPPPPAQVGRKQAQQPVPIDHRSGPVHGDDPVGVTVEGQPGVGPGRRTTAAARPDGSVEPHPALMLGRRGTPPSTSTTSAPAAARMSVPWTRRPRWRSRSPPGSHRGAALRGQSPRGRSTRPPGRPCDRAVSRRPERSDATGPARLPGPRRRGGAGGQTGQLGLHAASWASVSLRPPGANSLMPLSA